MQVKSRTRTPAHSGRAVPAPPSTYAGSSPLKAIITRLETGLGRKNLDTSLVLLSRPQRPSFGGPPGTKTINLLVGYTGSAHSQAALDLALCMAHQTRLAQPGPVMVHVVFVVDKNRPRTIANADRILWQARCLASEWRGSLNAHLRIGDVATALSQVAQEVEADVLLLGCHKTTHRLVTELADRVPCSVMGLPH